MDRYEKLWRDGVEAFRRRDYQSTKDVFQIVVKEFHSDCQAREHAHRMRGLCFQLQGDYPRALAEFELSLDANPQSPLAIDRLAYLLATAPDETLRDGARAEALASASASQRHEMQWQSMTILAAAKAELGDFEDAIATYEHAMQMMPDAEREKRHGRLAQLRAGQPLRCNPDFDRAHIFEFNRQPNAD